MTWGAIGGAAVSVIGGAMLSGGAGDAAGVQQGAAMQGGALQAGAAREGVSAITQQLEAFQKLMQPYIQGGSDAMIEKRALLGLGSGSGNPLDESNPAFWQAYQDNVKQFLANGGDLNDPNAEKYLRADTQRSLAAGTASGSYAINTPESQQAAAIKKFENSPYFSAITKASEDAILQNASATGGLRGGNTQDALSKNRPMLLQGLIDKQIANLTGLTASGQGAAATLGNAGVVSGDAIARTLMGGAGAQAGAINQAGAAEAGGILGETNAGVNALGGALGNLSKFATPQTPGTPIVNTGFGTGSSYGNMDMGAFL